MSKANPGTWERTTTVGKEPNAVNTADVGLLDFPDIIGDARAGVSVQMGFGFSFGAGKSSVTVHLTCNQDERTIDRAGELAMNKAQELVVEGMRRVDEELQKGHPNG
jgi:hypothetical protein